MTSAPPLTAGPNNVPPPARAPRLDDLLRLKRQLERDTEEELATLRRRDRRLGRLLSGSNELRILLAWLDTVAIDSGYETIVSRRIWALSAMLFLAMGALAMGGFLLADARGFVNALFLLAAFPALQLVLALASAFTLLRHSASGSGPEHPRHAGYWLFRRRVLSAIPGAEVVSGTLALHIGQLWGLCFSLGATAAFVVVPAVTELAFVWGSTFQLSGERLTALARTIALPWAAWLPGALPEPGLVEASRFRPGEVTLTAHELQAMRAWWPFLLMALLSYAVVPRMLLWLWSRLSLRYQLAQALLAMPGAALVLARISEPLVETAGREVERGSSARRADCENAAAALVPEAQSAHDLLLGYGVNFHDVFEACDAATLSGPAERRIALGLGRFEDDREQLKALAFEGPARIALLVRGWEPPVGELEDLLEVLPASTTLQLLLLSLPGEPLASARVQDWQHFAARLPFAAQARPVPVTGP